MERLMSDEEKIRRAEDVIERRKNAEFRISGENFSKEQNTNKTKKMFIQIVICLLIYCGVYYIKNSQDNLAKNVMSNINNILQQDIDFKTLYSNIVVKCNSIVNKNNENNIENSENVEIKDEPNNAEENIDSNSNQEESNTDNSINNEVGQIDSNLNIMGIGGGSEEPSDIPEQNELISDADYIKSNFSIINPLPSGIVTSRFGSRASNEIVSANHKGIDLGAVSGTEIINSMDGEVIEASSEGDFGKHIKVANNDIVIIYAHCSELLVKEGDKVKQGDKIAKVGSTGKATGPHLHFEIRRDNRAINPEEILQL